MNIWFFQFLPTFLDINKNISLVYNYLNENKDEIWDCDIIIFPEYFLSWSLSTDNLNEYEEKISKTDILEEFSKISNKYKNQFFVFGSILIKENWKFYNRSYVFKGWKIIDFYNKKALIYNERIICSSDNKETIFEVNSKKVWLAICWDIALPEIFRKYTKKADIVIIPSFWWLWWNILQSQYKFSLEKKYYKSLWIARAYENSFNLLFVNSVWKYKSDFYNDNMMWWSFLVEPPFWITYDTNNKKSDFFHKISLDFKNLNDYREYYATDESYFYYKDKKVIE